MPLNVRSCPGVWTSHFGVPLWSGRAGKGLSESTPPLFFLPVKRLERNKVSLGAEGRGGETQVGSAVECRGRNQEKREEEVAGGEKMREAEK